MKLRNRIHIYSTFLTLVILIILTAVIYFSFSSLTYSTEVEELESVSDALLRTYNSSQVSDPNEVLRGYVPVLGMITVRDSDRNVLELIQKPEITEQLPERLDGRSGTVVVEGERFAYTHSPIIWSDGTVQKCRLQNL